MFENYKVINTCSFTKIFSIFRKCTASSHYFSIKLKKNFEFRRSIIFPKTIADWVTCGPYG